jgi:hypothetical protein
MAPCVFDDLSRCCGVLLCDLQSNSGRAAQEIPGRVLCGELIRDERRYVCRLKCHLQLLRLLNVETLCNGYHITRIDLTKQDQLRPCPRLNRNQR